MTKTKRTVASSAITSRQKYWIKLSSWTAALRCLAPLCCITNSVQNTESSSGSTGRSLWRLESFWMFSLYLDKVIDTKIKSKVKYMLWAAHLKSYLSKTNILIIKAGLFCTLSHLVLLMISFNPWRRLSVVIEEKSKATPTPLLAILCALSGWSPEMGTINMGTAWHRPSKRPCEPAWVINARAPGCANTDTQIH